MIGGSMLTLWLAHGGSSEPDVYTLVYISPRQSTLLDDQRSLSQADMDEYQRYMRMQAALVKSPLVILAALRQPKVGSLGLLQRKPIVFEWVAAALHLAPQQSDVYGWVARKLQIDFPNDAGIMRIGMRGGDPDELIVLIDAVVQAYMDEIVRAEDNKQLDRIAKLKDVSNRYEEQLRARRRAYKELAEAASTKNELVLGLKQQFAHDQLTASRKELMAVKKQLRTLKVEVEVQSAQMRSNKVDSVIKDELLEEMLDKDKSVLTFMDEIRSKEAKRDQAVLQLAPEHRMQVVQGYNQEIEKLKKTMLEYRQAQRGRLRDELLARERESLQARLRTDNQRIAVLQKLETQLTSEIEDLLREIKSAAANSVELELDKDEMDKVSDVAKKLREQVEKANVEAGQPARIRILEKAHRSY
jgi:hypothetical protein